MAKSGPVQLGVRRDLAALDERARRSGLAASALAIARRLDIDELLTARDQAGLSAELRQTVAELHRQHPVVRRQEGKVDEISARRAARRAASG